MKGYALITSLIVLAVSAGLVLGFIAQVNTQSKIGLNDVDYSSAFYAAEAGLEKLNSDLSKLFQVSVYPTTAQITTIQGSSYMPPLAGMTYSTYSITGGQQTRLTAAMAIADTTATVADTAGWPSSGYFMIGAESFTYSGLTATTFTGLVRGVDATVPAAHPSNANVSRSQVITISQGPNSGLNAQVIPFTLQVVAQAASGTEAKLSRDVQVALVPVFQFGVFSDSDLSFFAGPNFGFGGRVHTNGNLYLAEGNINTLTLAQKVTTARDVIRTQLSNGWDTNTNYTGTVNMMQTPGVYRALARTEGSLVGGPGSAVNSGWRALSLTTYNGNILNSATGARALTLPFAGGGVSPVEIIKRPSPLTEDPTTILGESRLYNQSSLRVLLSDSLANLPAAPVFGNPVGYSLNTGGSANASLTTMPYNYVIDATHPPFAQADPNDPDYITVTNADETASSALIDGFIRIDMQRNDNTWQDVTMEILNLGISSSNANAVLRFQKLKPTKAAGSTVATDYMPMNLFDAREGRFRNLAATGTPKIGIMGLVELDINNLKRWFQGTIGASGTNALTNNGYIFYFSDRRGNRDANGNETGEFGFEDIVNTGSDASGGFPNDSLNTGEDFNGNGTLETYGGNLPVNPFTAYPTNTDLYNTYLDSQSTTLGVAITVANSTSAITVASTAGWTAPGFFAVDQEAITFTGMTGTIFTGIARGAFGTTPATHLVNATVNVGQQTALSAAWASGTSPANGSTIGVTSTAGWGTSGYVVAGTEYVTYTSKTTNQFVNITRGAMGSTAAAHTSGTAVKNANKAKKNRVWYFRRALRLINGVAPNLPAPGFTVAAENPVYVQGDYNVSGGAFTNGTHSYAAVIADAVTLLSNSWTDDKSFDFPYTASSRSVPNDAWYRLAIASGKGPSFSQPAGTAQDFGTDGGTHNFLRFLEDWNSTLHYTGSIVSLYFARQGLGTYKGGIVYAPPNRDYSFDTEFLVPSQLPPGTPRFRDINNLSFRQMIRAEQ